MKVRIKQNGLRFRLNEKDAQALIQGKGVQIDCPIFHGVDLVFRIVPAKTDEAEMHYHAPTVELAFPKHDLIAFLQSNKEGWHHDFQIDGKMLMVSVEKDLAYFRKGLEA